MTHQAAATTPNNILLVLTSHDDLAGIRPTGFYVSEAADPWQVFTEHGYQVDLAAVRAGFAPMDGYDEGDVTQRAFLQDAHIAAQLSAIRGIESVQPEAYRGVFFVGGHGTMWDFPQATHLQSFTANLYEAGGVIGAVCHGPAALLGIRLSDGTHLMQNRRVAGFTNDEEEAVGLTNVVPFSLADELTARGAIHLPAPNFTPQVVSDGRLVTGQNPQSAAGVARAMIPLLAAHGATS